MTKRCKGNTELFLFTLKLKLNAKCDCQILIMPVIQAKNSLRFHILFVMDEQHSYTKSIKIFRSHPLHPYNVCFLMLLIHSLIHLCCCIYLFLFIELNKIDLTAQIYIYFYEFYGGMKNYI